ncbi:MAG TPA: glycoside hydrolase family 16 protein [Solirubrobacteraceae bacterium]
MAASLVLSFAAIATTSAPALAAAPATAHTASRTATLIVHPASIGRYEVIVWVRSRTKHAALVKVYLSGQRVQRVRANPWWGARAYYTLNLTGKKLTVHTVNNAPAVQVRASLILKKAASSAPQVSITPSVSVAPTVTTPAPTPTPAPVATPAQPPYSSLKTLIWQDNFAGPAGSAPNPANWRYDTGPSCDGGGCSTDTASTANAYLTGNNQLAITALNSGGSTTAAQLESPTAVFHVGEEIDANIKLPAGQGLWGGFWLLEAAGTSCSNPDCGELDVLEAPEMGPTPNEAFFTLHGPVSGSSNTQQWEGGTEALGDLSQGFHTYGIIWTPGSIQYTIDGVVYATATPNQLTAGSTWEFDSGNYNMLLDLAVGGWPGPPTAATQFPATMLINWVRVYN